jgi:RNA polymerase sigma factor (sigma-70 family)
MLPTKLSHFLRSLTRGMAAETLMDLSDRHLVERFLGTGDKAVFDALVRRHGPMVYRVCWRVLQHAQDCEDAFQSTFLVLAQKLGTVRSLDSLASWLHGVAHRVALKARAQAAHRRRHEREAANANTYVGPPDEIAWRDLRTVLDAELARLPEKLRLPLILCYLEARTQAEAATQLGWSQRTLLRRLDEARSALARRLARKGFALSAPLAAVLLTDCAVSAALPWRLIASTCEAACCVASGKVVPAGLVSATVVSLTHGVSNTMSMTTFKTALIAVLWVGLVAGAGIVFCQSYAGQTEAQKPGASRFVSQADAKAKGPVSKPLWREGPTLGGHADAVTAVAVSRDGKLLASGGADGDVILWDRATERVKTKLRGHKGRISCVAFSPDGTFLATGSRIQHKTGKHEGQVKLWDIATGKERAALKLGQGEGRVYSIAFSPDGKLLAASGDLGREPSPNDEAFGIVVVWEVGTQKEKATFTEDWAKVGNNVDVYIHQPIHSVVFSPSGKHLATSGINQVKLIDLETREEIVLKEKGEPPGEDGIVPVFIGIAFAPDGKTVATRHTQCGVKVWDAATGKERAALPKREDKNEIIFNALAFSRDSKTLVTLASGEVNLWEAASGKLRQTLPVDSSPTSIALSRDGRTLAVGTGGNVRVWDLQDPKK